MGGDGSPKIHILFHGIVHIGSDSVLVGGWDWESDLPSFTDDQSVDKECLFEVRGSHQ